MKLTFLGAAHEVTGSRFLLEACGGIFRRRGGKGPKQQHKQQRYFSHFGFLLPKR